MRKPGPEWLRRAIAEIETAPRPAEAVPSEPDYYRDEVRPMPEMRPRMNAPPLFTPPTPAPEPLPQPPPQRQAPPAAQRNIFDMVWPSERNRASEGPAMERQTESMEPMREQGRSLRALWPRAITKCA